MDRDTAPPTPPAPPGFAPVPPARPPDPSAPRRRGLIALGAVALALVVIGAGLFLLTGRGAGPGATPPPASSGAPAATAAGPSTPGAGASPLDDDAVAQQIDAVVGTVPAIRGLQPMRDVPNSFIDPSELTQTLLRIFEEENTPEQLQADEELHKRLGLLPRDYDLKAGIVELYGSQVAAFYQPDNGEFYIVRRNASFGPADEIIVAHEYTHALQDQHFDLDEFLDLEPTEGDRILARQALTEGDATLLMSLWASENLEPLELLEAFTSSGSPADQELLAAAPPILQRQLLFPYLDGLTFVQALHGGGGWGAVDAAYRDPPESSEQILHPDKYLSREAPAEVRLPALEERLGAGWTVATEGVLGEVTIQVWAADGAPPPGPLGGPQPGAAVAAGWGGDRAVSIDGPNGAWAVVWQTEWDTASEADEFRAAAGGVMQDLPGAHSVAGRSITGGDDARSVLVVIANDQASLDLVAGALR